MKLLRQDSLLLALAMLIWPILPVLAQDEVADGKGAIIIVSVEGDVKIKKVGTEDFLPQEEIAAGKSIFDGHTVVTDEAGKLPSAL